MKYALLLLCAVVLALTGCDGPSVTKNAPSGSLQVQSVSAPYATGCTDDTCYYTYDIDFVDKRFGLHNYWVRICDSRDTFCMLEPKRLYISDTGATRTLYFTIPYYANVGGLIGWIEVVRQDAATGGDRAVAKHSDTTIVGRFSAFSDCHRDCCTDQRGYVGVEKQVAAGVSAVTGDIVVRIGNMCGCPYETNQSFGAALIATRYDTTVNQHQCIWAQVGYTTIRYQGDQSTVTWSLGEMMTYDSTFRGPRYDSTLTVLSEGDSIEYRVEFDAGSRQWCGYRGSTLFWRSPADPLWLATNGGSCCRWFGEVRHYESDMPGSSAYPCTFANCGYVGGGGYWAADLAYDVDTVTNDTSAWKYVRTGYSAFEIWDVNRLTP